MPKVEKSKAGKEGRSTGSAPKRSATVKGKEKATAVSMAREISRDSATLEMESISVARHDSEEEGLISQDGQEPEEQVLTATREKSPEHLPSAMPAYDANSQQLRGRVEQVFFEDFTAIEKVLQDPGRTASSVFLALSELKASHTREKSHIGLLAELVKERGDVVEYLTERMGVEVDVLRLNERHKLSIRRQQLENPGDVGEQGGNDEEGTGARDDN